MDRRVVWTESAWGDLEMISEYIRRDSPRYAGVVMRELLDAASSLTISAHRGRMVPEFADPAIRELIVGNYRLLYKVDDASVAILGIVHGARDLKSIWDHEER